MKRLFALLCAALCLLTGCAKKTSQLLAPDAGLYVTDRAEVLTAETKEQVLAHVGALKRACGGEIAVVTVDFLNDLPIETYAHRLMNDWGVGDGKKNNGCLLLLVVGENSYYLLPGCGIEDDLTADRVDDLLKTNLAEPFAAGDYDLGVQKTVNALLNWYCGHYNVRLYVDEQSPLQQFFGGGQAEVLGFTVPTWVWIAGGIVLLLVILKLVGSFFSSGR